jgi:hypothetical protein
MTSSSDLLGPRNVAVGLHVSWTSTANPRSSRSCVGCWLLRYPLVTSAALHLALRLRQTAHARGSLRGAAATARRVFPHADLRRTLRVAATSAVALTRGCTPAFPDQACHLTAQREGALPC